MPVESPPPVVLAYQLFLLLAGIACCIHFFFLSKRTLRIESHQAVPGWRLSFADFFFGLFAIVFTILLVVSALATLVPIAPEGDAIELILSGGGMQIAALLVLYAFYKMSPGKFQDPINSRKLTWADASKAALYSFLIVIAIMLPVTAAWVYVLEAFGQEIELQETVVIFSQTDDLPIMLLMIVVIVLGAPLSEEVLFRGCLYRFLKAKMSVGAAMILSAFLFALLHPNLPGFVPLFILGVVLAYAYEKTGSIKVPILIHGIFNLNTVIIIVLTMNGA